MSGAGQIQVQIDLAVAAAVAPLIQGIAELTKRVSELENPAETQVKAAPAKGVTARAGTAGLKAEAKNPQ
jgi:hypothetical protein